MHEAKRALVCDCADLCDPPVIELNTLTGQEIISTCHPSQHRIPVLNTEESVCNVEAENKIRSSRS